MVATRLRPSSSLNTPCDSAAGQKLRSLDTSAGATLVEFVLVGAVFLFFVLAIMDFGRSLVLQNLADTAAEQAAKQASVIEWLDTDCASVPDVPAGTRAACNNNRRLAIWNVLESARRFPTTTLFSPIANRGMQWIISGTDTAPAVEVILSANNNYRAWFMTGQTTSSSSSQFKRSNKLAQLDSPSSNPKLKRVLQSEPIEVNIRARFRPVLGLLGEFPVWGRARAFREIRGVSSYPARVNCQGQEVPIGQPIVNSNCPCEANPANPLVIQQGANCVCRYSGMVPVTNGDGQVISCTCPPGQNLNGANNGCVCTPVQCTGGMTQDSSCSCSCPGQLELQNGTCGCIPPLQQNGNSCSCPSNPACTNSGGSLNSQCQCGCPGQLDPNTGTCGCPGMNCGPNGTPNLQCGCDCQNGFTGSGNTCTCPSPRQVVNGQCKCPNTCTNGTLTYDCKCRCDYPLVPSGNQCVCPTTNCNGGVQNSSCGCNCPNVPCQGGTVTANCTCRCPDGQNNIGGVCQCPSVTCNGGTVTSSCQCQCPPTQVNNGGSCQCPDGWTQNPDGSCSIPE